VIPLLCPACGTFALSFFGQLEQLDSYLLSQEGPPADTAGSWHTKCLRASTVGAAWAAARLRNFVDVRGYGEFATSDHWSVLLDPRDGKRIAVAESGQVLVLPAAGRLIQIGGDTAYRERKREYNLHIPDAELISVMQKALLRDGVCPLAILFEGLGVTEHLDHPDVLADAHFHHVEDELRDEWTHVSILAAVEYNVYIPPELVPYCR
jgi:hypothetical protein